jgi:hypothetical protein
MQAPNVSGTRQQITAVFLKLLAVGFGLCALPFLGEGLENLLQGDRLWALECFAMALIPLAIAYGLWRQQRWVRAAALWVSVLAIPLLPLLTIAAAIFSYSAGFTALVLALFLGLFASLIVYFLTSPETKALFGVSAESGSQRRSMIPRPALGTALLAAVAAVGGVAAVCVVAEAVRIRRQAAVNERISERVVGELKPLLEAELRSISAEAFVSRHCGAFQSLDEVRFTQMHFPTGVSTRRLTGVARFEKADFYINVQVTDGATADVELRFWPDENWLTEHPEPRVRIVHRQLEVSAALVGDATGYGRIDGSASCPAFLLSN